MSEKLKPCPFCESENVHAYTYKDAVYRQYAVKCKKCGARIMAQSTELAIEKWNRRAERTAKVRPLEKRSETSMSWEGKCSNCGAYTIHEMNYCFECGAKLEWSE